MDSAILSAASALIGSLVGGGSTLAAAWFTKRRQFGAQSLLREATKRETLYSEFIVEVSQHLADAWTHQVQSPEVLAGLYSNVQRMRLASSAEVVAAAEDVLRHVLEAYAAPARTFDELHRHIRNDDLPNMLENFSEACKTELSSLRG
jgi:hypothetical protein